MKIDTFHNANWGRVLVTDVIPEYNLKAEDPREELKRLAWVELERPWGVLWTIDKAVAHDAFVDAGLEFMEHPITGSFFVFLDLNSERRRGIYLPHLGDFLGLFRVLSPIVGMVRRCDWMGEGQP